MSLSPGTSQTLLTRQLRLHPRFVSARAGTCRHMQSQIEPTPPSSRGSIAQGVQNIMQPRIPRLGNTPPQSTQGVLRTRESYPASLKNALRSALGAGNIMQCYPRPTSASWTGCAFFAPLFQDDFPFSPRYDLLFSFYSVVLFQLDFTTTLTEWIPSPR